MPVTAEDVELEFQEEQSKKADARAKAESKLRSDSSGVPRVAGFLLVVGIIGAGVMFLLPQRSRFLPVEDVQVNQVGALSAVNVNAPATVQKADVAAVAGTKSDEKDDEAEEGGDAEDKADDNDDADEDADSKTEEDKKSGSAEDDAAPEGKIDPPPSSIRELAERHLGKEESNSFFAGAICSKRKYKGKELWFWHHKKDELDFNPDPNYRFEVLKELPTGSLAIDIGANLGDTAVLAHSVNPRIQVLSLEPSPENYIFMRWNLLRNGVPELSEQDFGSKKPGVLALLGGATRDGRKIELAFAPEHTKHAQVKSDAVGYGAEIPDSIDSSQGRQDAKTMRRYSGKWKKLTVPSFAVHTWLASHRAPDIRWFKLDCEGCEYEVLLDLVDGGFLKHAKVITGEAHYRHVADLSCKQRPAETKCKDMISKVKRVRNLMCNKYKFSCCPKVMNCDVFQEECKKRKL